MMRDRGDSRKSIAGDLGSIGPSHTINVGAARLRELSTVYARKRSASHGVE